MQIANVAYFQRKIQLSGFSANPDGSPSKLIQVSGVSLNMQDAFCNVIERVTFTSVVVVILKMGFKLLCIHNIYIYNIQLYIYIKIKSHR
jgi:hypothetical protein